jgi:hypothetical protein
MHNQLVIGGHGAKYTTQEKEFRCKCFESNGMNDTQNP